jgi:glycine dehydrogenase subunit 1
MHVSMLGPDGLVDLANDCVRLARETADRLDDIVGVQAPLHDRHHFREFVVHTDQPAAVLVEDLAEEGFAVHEVGEHEIQVCVTETTEPALDAFVTMFEEVVHR